MQYVYELCEKLPRCGPGDNESTRKAFHAMPNLPKVPHVLDIGCGSGMQTIELAKISNGSIVALDNHQGFLDLLMEKASKEGLEKNIAPTNTSMLEMDFEPNSFDVVWSEGALYFMGFQKGLKRCRELLKQGGCLAFTELVYIAPDLPDPVVQYFQSEYPDIKSIEEKIKLIENKGFRLLEHFTLPKSSWLEPYYLPMEKELPYLMNKYKNNEMALGVFRAFQEEVGFYKKYSSYYGYEFFVMQNNN